MAQHRVDLLKSGGPKIGHTYDLYIDWKHHATFPPSWGHKQDAVETARWEARRLGDDTILIMTI